ncbi:hypothetical protein EVG20_g9508 [Dentipellis fragilis]|uniref:Uncharacterized protein n=1 Tax=Dentipellis fragilis TaxID=205917 RepID=A0A4Y9XXV1_9AGAM|nr:hypothetical protein EVG20_g9508 [Dentipellis fragilis]
MSANTVLSNCKSLPPRAAANARHRAGPRRPAPPPTGIVPNADSPTALQTLVIHRRIFGVIEVICEPLDLTRIHTASTSLRSQLSSVGPHTSATHMRTIHIHIDRDSDVPAVACTNADATSKEQAYGRALRYGTVALRPARSLAIGTLKEPTVEAEGLESRS